MQTLITIPFPRSFPNTLEARAYLSKLMDGKLPNELFNHQSNGRSIQHPSPFRFAYLNGSLRITGIGHYGASMLFGVFPSILERNSPRIPLPRCR